LRLFTRFFVLWMLIAAAGCGPAIPKEHLGKPLFEIPKVPGVEQPYQLPELDAADESESPPPAEADGSA